MSVDRLDVVVTEDEPSYGVLAGVRALRREGWRPWLAVSGPGTYASRSRAVAGTISVPDAAADPDAYVAALSREAAARNAAAILPGTEVGLVALAGRAVPDGIASGAPAAHLVDRVTDKAAVERVAEAAGLDVPATTTVRREEVEAAAGRLEYPVVVKSTRTKVRSGDGRLRHGTVRRADDADAFLAVAAGLPGDELIVQPFLEGRLEAVAGVAWEGRLVTAVHQAAHRIAPRHCGLSAFAETVPRDSEVEAAVARLVAGLEWSGLFQAQFIRSGPNAALIDFNPRMYGSLALAVSAGANLPAVWLRLLLGLPPAPTPYRVGARYRAEEKDARLLGDALRRGRLAEAAAVLVPHRDVTHAAFALRDPLPLLSSLAKVKRLRA